jgi:hypothetical protein
MPAAKLIEVVVSPTPPFWLMVAMFLLGIKLGAF